MGEVLSTSRDERVERLNCLFWWLWVGNRGGGGDFKKKGKIGPKYF